MKLLDLLYTTTETRNFEFSALTAEEAAKGLLYGAREKSEFAKPGYYRVLSGSRGMIEEVEYLGTDATKIEVLSRAEAIMAMLDGSEDKDGKIDAQDVEAAVEYVDEYYFAAEDSEVGGVINFGYTEEEFDYFFLVK